MGQMYENYWENLWERLRKMGTVAGTVAKNYFFVMFAWQKKSLYLCTVKTKTDGRQTSM